VSTLTSSTVQSKSASISPSTHLVCIYTFSSYIFVYIFVYIFIHPRLHSSVDAQRRLCSKPALICWCTAVSTVQQLHFRVHFRTSTPTFIAVHHLTCFQGGKECMATLHSSDRDFTLLYILYILHLHLANIFVIQATTYVLHFTSTFWEHFPIYDNAVNAQNFSFSWAFSTIIYTLS
jgi:hypothetical protein